jgi:hypothetical protein
MLYLFNFILLVYNPKAENYTKIGKYLSLLSKARTHERISHKIKLITYYTQQVKEFKHLDRAEKYVTGFAEKVQIT